jgi:hypothetical protein
MQKWNKVQVDKNQSWIIRTQGNGDGLTGVSSVGSWKDRHNIMSDPANNKCDRASSYERTNLILLSSSCRFWMEWQC